MESFLLDGVRKKYFPSLARCRPETRPCCDGLQVYRVLDDLVVVLHHLLVDRLHERPGLRHGLDLLIDDVVQDVAEGVLVVIVQQRVDHFLESHQPVFLLCELGHHL